MRHIAKRFLANTNPLGHVLGSGEDKRTIVGVVSDSKYGMGVAEETPMPMAYYAAMQFSSLGTMHLEVRTHGDAMVMLPALRKSVAALYPSVPLERPMTQEAQFEKSYEKQRMFAALGGFFGVLAALLVATGLYGTYSFRVSRRRTEIGLRMALGATRSQVLTMIMRESLWVIMLGLAAGIPLTLGVADVSVEVYALRDLCVRSGKLWAGNCSIGSGIRVRCFRPGTPGRFR